MMGKAILLLLFISTMSLAPASRAERLDPIPNPQLWRDLLNAAPEVPLYQIPGALPLEWEKHHPERILWSQYSYSVIDRYFGEFQLAKDMGQFCPNYEALTHEQQVQAWAQLFVGVSHWESSWDPTERTLEDQGIDPETGEPVYSDGLLQLSYQDIESNPYCPFDWKTDQHLASDDIHRTIFNPFNNLYCGIRTMADIVRDGGHIIDGGYWSTLESKGLHSKVRSISAEMRKTLPFCGSRIRGNPLAENWTKFANLYWNRKLVNGFRRGTGWLKKIFRRRKSAGDSH